jgi:hypothetical protein
MWHREVDEAALPHLAAGSAADRLADVVADLFASGWGGSLRFSPGDHGRARPATDVAAWRSLPVLHQFKEVAATWRQLAALLGMR